MKFDFEREDKKPRIKKICFSIILWIIQIILVVGLAYFIVHFTIERTTMNGISMENTLVENDKIIINKFIYRFQKPQRFDVIVFKQSDREHSFYNIKRVIGLPGETVQIENGIVYINGKKLEEKTIVEEIQNSGLAFEEVLLDENEYFVLGDNRNNSEDSRFANIGNISFQDIIGKAFIRTNGFTFIDTINLRKEVE